MRTLCNPMNLPYRFRSSGRQIRREAADPSVVAYDGKLWLFPSKSRGFWWSDDGFDWTFVKSENLPTDHYAPDVRVVNGCLYFSASNSYNPGPMMRTKDPLSDEWEVISGPPFKYTDPHVFQDDDGRTYFYWGCSNVEPIRGVEADPETMEPLGEPVELIHQNENSYGWERCAENGEEDKPPWIEGPWMTKHEGTYYLQYAGPATQFNTYADGVYMGQTPLGPFTYARNNPMSFQPGGFITGAGHGSTFRDFHGNWWHISTMRISVQAKFERRLGIWPAGFDKDGVMFCNNRFGDFPMRFPEGKWDDPWTDLSTGWMPLHYRKIVDCSSAQDEHGAAFAVDENIRTCWAATRDDERPWLSVDLGSVCQVHALQINFYEHDCSHPVVDGPHQYQVLGSQDNSTWTVLVDRLDSDQVTPHDYVHLDAPGEFRYIKVSIKRMPAGGVAALSGLRVFGSGSGEHPEATELTTAQLLPDDALTARLEWTPIPDAIGYNVRWGIAPDKLYHDWLVYDSADLNLTALNLGQETWVAVEAFNENGVADASPIIRIEEIVP